MKPKKKPLLPVDIKLPERVLLEDGVMYWRNEQAAGESYYGDENEAASVS